MMDNIYANKGLLVPPSVDFAAVRDGRRSPLANFDLDLSTARSIAAGTHQIIEVAGDALICDMDPVGQGYAVLHVQDTLLTARTAPVYVTPGSIIKAPFTRLLVENAAQPGMRLRVFYGVGIDFQAGAGANVTVSGTVQVIDGEKARTLAGGMLAGAPASVGAVGTVPMVQLWNPSANKNLILTALDIYSNTAQPFIIISTATAAPVDVTATSVFNKRLTAAIGAGQARTDNTNAAAPGNKMRTAFLAANVPYGWPIKGAIVVAPSTGLNVFGGNVNTTLGANFEWFEE